MILAALSIARAADAMFRWPEPGLYRSPMAQLGGQPSRISVHCCALRSTYSVAATRAKALAVASAYSSALPCRVLRAAVPRLEDAAVTADSAGSS